MIVFLLPPTAVINASTEPSPPSATGMEMVSLPGKYFFTFSSRIPQICAELNVPLKESGISTNFMFPSPPFLIL